jgi:hypothetical protein
LRRLSFGLAGLLLPVSARAECMGSCLDAMMGALAALAIYGVLAVVILVLLIVSRWRKAGVILLAATVLVAVGVPLATQGWQAWRLSAMERREIVGAPPALTDHVPLLIAPGSDCLYDACASVLLERGNSGTYILPEAALSGLDLTKPLRLADLPLEQWGFVSVAEGAISPRGRILTPEERQAVAARLDYLVIVTSTHIGIEQGPIEAALRANPAMAGMGSGEVVHVALAPLDPSNGTLSLAELRFDLLDLWFSGRAMTLPLAPYNFKIARNDTVGLDLAVEALCSTSDQRMKENCRNYLW